MGNSESMAKFEDLELERSKGKVHEDWNIIPGTLRGYDVTVFSSVHPQSSRKRPYIEKALQASKVYRHPGILKYMDGGLLGNEIIVITEEATPLLTHGIENMSFLQITAGLASIVEALAFLHDKAGVSHNNVCASSIYVTSEGIWKLWGLEYSCSFGDLTRDHIEKINQYCNEKSIPPDDKNRISPAYQHARDSFFFGKFIDEVIAPSMNIDDHMIEEFVRFVKLKSLHNDWAERPRFSSLLEHSVFQHEFLKLRKNLNNILILPMEERNEFIRSLPKMLKNYSEEVISSTFASVLLSHSFLLVPFSSTHLMPILLTPKSAESEFGLFSAKVFKETVVPLILHLFSIHDATIRKILLTHFEHYAPLIEKNQLAKFVLPQLLLGIRDTDEELVSKTLQALGYLIPIVGANVVTGVNREQIFATATPKTAPSIRTVGKIRNKKALELQLASSKQKSADVSCNVHIVQESPSSDFLSVMNNSEFEAAPSLDIPERSSPDGGENIDIDKSNLVKEDINGELMDGVSDDQWSDWEEMLDQPTPDIVGILQVKSPDGDNTYFGESNVNCSSVVSSQEASNKNSSSRNVISKDKVLQKGSAMHLKSQIEAKVGKSHGLGEEYDIKCLEIDKKPDAERDLFAELTPNLLTKGYNLETMLLEASQKARPKLSSLSNTLAELNEADIEEGDEWNTENVFSSSEETNSPDIDGKNSPLESSLRT